MLNYTLYQRVKENLCETQKSYIQFKNCINESCTTLKAKITKNSENSFSYKLIGIFYHNKIRDIKIIMEKENVNSDELKEFLGNILFFGEIDSVTEYERIS